MYKTINMAAIRTKFSIEKELGLCSDERRTAIRAKLDQIDEAMKSTSRYRLRDDSKLAFMVSRGDFTMSMEDLVHELSVIQWISANTEYHKLLEETMRKVAEIAREKYKLRNWNAMWAILREFVPDIVKYEVIARHGSLPNLKKIKWGDEEDD